MSAPAYLAGLSCSRLLHFLHFLHYLHSLHFQYYFAKVGIEGMINLLWVGACHNSPIDHAVGVTQGRQG